MPVRAALALVATAVAVVLLASFKTPDQPTRRAAGLLASPPAATAPASSAATAEATAGASATPTPSSGWRDGRYTGDPASTRYGDVQVAAVISGGKLTDVVSVQLPSDLERSAFISEQAGPLLHDEALQAQSAQIDVLSGATYTSYGYAQSLQSALDKAHG